MGPVAAFTAAGTNTAWLLCRGCRKQHAIQARSIFSLFEKWKKKDEVETPTNYAVVKAGKVSPVHSVPEGIKTPEYAFSGIPAKAPARQVILLDQEGKECMREAGKLARKLLDFTAAHVEVGVTTDRLDEVIHQACIDHKAYPSTLNYNRFPKSVCTSVNNVMVHGIPDDRPLEDGDIINIDFTVFLNGYHADLSETYLVGDVDEAGRHLVKYARICRDEAIKVCAPHTPISRIGRTISSIGTAAGLYVSPSFVGHGINVFFHCKPDIWHYSNFYPEQMLPGMTFTIEPVLLERSDLPAVGEDQWTVYAQNHTRSAQFEHTILITETGFEVLTAGENTDFSKNVITTKGETGASGAMDKPTSVDDGKDWDFEQKT